MIFDPYLATLARLTPAQLAVEVAVRLKAFNRVEDARKSWEAIDDARQRHRLAMREMAKRGEGSR